MWETLGIEPVTSDLTSVYQISSSTTWAIPPHCQVNPVPITAWQTEWISNWEIWSIVLAGVWTRDLRIVGQAYYHYTTTPLLALKNSVQILKTGNFCSVKLSAEDVCRTDNFLDRLDNISTSSYLLLWIKR